MANWKKVIVSGSNAELNHITASGNISGAGELYFSSSEENYSDIVVVDIATGKLYRTASSAISTTVDYTLQSPTDNDLADGLLTFQSGSTTYTDAIDEINEVLAALAPGPAPDLDDIYDTVGDTLPFTAKLSFGSSNTTPYTYYVNPSSLSSPTSNLGNVNVNGSYTENGASSNDIRIGVFNATSSYTSITGRLNEDVGADAGDFVNYGADAFKDGEKGVLALFVNNNSTPTHTVSLSGSESAIASSLNGNGSGFTSISAAIPAHFKSSGTELTVFKHRSGSFVVHPSDQRAGWNYARVEHQLPTETRQTNFIEWVNETDTNALVATADSTTTVANSFSGTGLKVISGVGYYTGYTATYQAVVTNVYRNIYSDSSTAIRFDNSNTTLNQYTQAIATGSHITHDASNTDSGLTSTTFTRELPPLNSSLTNEHLSTLQLTGSLSGRSDVACCSTSTPFSVYVDVTHPTKADISNGASLSLGTLLYDTRTNDSTLQLETFVTESTGRLPVAAYDTQVSVTNAIGTFDATSTLNTDELLVLPFANGTNTTGNTGNGSLVHPTDGINSGNFTTITNKPGPTPNYSGDTNTRKYMRTFQNSGGSTANATIIIEGAGTIVAYNSGLSGNEFYVRIKFPGTTAWLDLATSPSPGQSFGTDNQGCLVGTLDSSVDATNTFTTSGTGGGGNMANGDYIVVEITAASTWTGHIDKISVFA